MIEKSGFHETQTLFEGCHGTKRLGTAGLDSTSFSTNRQ